MSNPELIKRSGWLFITGAFAFLTILSNSDNIQIPGSVISALLLMAGMLSLRAAYAESFSRFSRNILLTGAIVTILWIMIFAYLIAMSNSGNLTDAQGQRYWIVAFGGPAVALLALTLFGLNTLRSKPLTYLSWLPVITGIWYPVAYSFLFVYLISHNGVLPGQYWPVVKITFVIQFFALSILGFVLLEDSSKELATA